MFDRALNTPWDVEWTLAKYLNYIIESNIIRGEFRLFSRLLLILVAFFVCFGLLQGFSNKIRDKVKTRSKPLGGPMDNSAFYSSNINKMKYQELKSLLSTYP